MTKKRKVFIESRSTALELAQSIADSQELKSSIKRDRNQERTENRIKPNKSASNNIRLKLAKEAALKHKLEAKKRKAERRKATKPTNPTEPQVLSTPAPRKAKTVSFA